MNIGDKVRLVEDVPVGTPTGSVIYRTGTVGIYQGPDEGAWPYHVILFTDQPVNEVPLLARAYTPVNPTVWTDELLEAAWEALGDAPVYWADEDEYLDEDRDGTLDDDFVFQGECLFLEGHEVLDIWYWFDERHSGGIRALSENRV